MPGHKSDAAAILLREYAKTIMLDLMNPVGAIWRRFGTPGQAGLPAIEASKIGTRLEIHRHGTAHTEFSAKQFFADPPPSSTELLRRAAETDPEVASLLSVHPRNVDDAILLVHPLG
jgi:hypothetical protein